MARPKNRKRRCADEAAQDNPSPKRLRADEADQGDHTTKRKRPHLDEPPRAAKKFKSTSDHNFVPRFWDNLSRVWLTQRALRELNRRNNACPPRESTKPNVYSKSLARFARHGGPDLCHLRGYPPQTTEQNMSSRGSSSRWTQSTRPTSVSSKARRSSAYDKDFEQNLIDHGIYPKGYEYSDSESEPDPLNLESVREELSAPRPSLSPSRFTPSAFKSFARANDRVISEGKVMSDLLPVIRGNADIPNEGNLAFTNFDSITNGLTVDAVPDLYDGAQPRDIGKTIREDLNKTIIPTNHTRAPVAPNFFVEAKAPRGGADVAGRQACYDGALGVRAMHSLQNYGKEDATYDGNAYTFSSTYHSGTGTLQLNAHHMTAPKAPGDRPEYHMTQVDGWMLTGNINSFRRGATAFRNARDLAKRHRDTFIQDANARASQSQTVTAQNPVRTCADPGTEPVGHTDYLAAQDADDALQQHIANTSHYNSEDDDEASVIPHYLFTEDDSRKPSQNSVTSGLDEPSTSFQSSFTSSVASGSKRPRPSFSPPLTSKRTFLALSRTHIGTAGQSGEPPTREPLQPDSNKYWVETYWREGNVSFRDLDGHEFNTMPKDWVEQAVEGTKCFSWRSTKSGRAFWASELPRDANRGTRHKLPE